MNDVATTTPLATAWKAAPAGSDAPLARLPAAFARSPTDALAEALAEAGLSAADATGPLSADKLSEALSEVLTRVATSVGAGGGAGGATPRWSELDRILRDYQVRNDEMVDYRPDLGPLPIDVPFVKEWKVTATEKRLLDKLQNQKGTEAVLEFYAIYKRASDVAEQRFPGNAGDTDGHRDAFRHAYWNALMAKRYGQEFAEAFGTAHEGKPNNPAEAEAMDLYNNELGRRIARENPDASDKELAQLVYEAVQGGDALVIDAEGGLAWSDEVAVGGTGKAEGSPTTGGRTPKDDPYIG